AQFRELEAFAKFGSDLDKSTLQQLNRGKIMVEILKQNQYVPMSVENQVAIIFAGVNGYLDDLEIEQISAYEKDLMEYLSANNQKTLDAITSSGKLDENSENDLKTALDNFGKTFKK
ncbi:MAG: F0F1 ATP synthase subunit alpha, partial [Candidatus Marinimicrobia bacterium]|nr:F0F1 ATP synthase subunit alpha [Candidatus Neomarinimicrobiota bacterium]